MTTIGRIGELAAMADLVSSTAAGVGRVLLLEGEAGVGKTHLVGEATARARQAGFIVIEVTVDELVRRPGVVPHALLEATVPGLSCRDRLDRLLNTTRRTLDDGGDLSFAVFESSVDLIEEIARSAPVLVTVEDLHWADDLSLTVLAAVTRRATVSRAAPFETHLSHVFRKVGVTGRTHLAAELARRGPPSEPEHPHRRPRRRDTE